MGYAVLNKCVFNLDLKTARVGASLISMGSLLYSMGAKREKARPPYDWVAALGSTRRDWLEDLSMRVGV